MRMASSTPTESSLLSKLELSDSTPIYSLYSNYLRPFSDLNKQDQTLIRSLAKKFLSFLNKSLTILPKRLSDSNSHLKDPKLVAELFDVYRLCLDCLEVVSSQLSCKPYSIQRQRLRFFRRLGDLGKDEDAESEGIRILEVLRGMTFEGKSQDAEFAMVFLEAVAEMVKYAAIGRRKDIDVYRRVLGLVEEAVPWFRVVDANAYEKLYRVLATYLDKCSVFLVEELMFFGDLSHQFCVVTVTQYATLSMTDQIYKFSHRICSSLFSLSENKPSLIIDVILCILDSLADQCKIEVDNRGMKLVEFVSYCSNKCRAAGTVFCDTVAGHLNHIAGNFPEDFTPIDLILRIYATGLYLTNCNLKFSGGDLTSTRGGENEFVKKFLLDEKDSLHNLDALLGLLRSYFSVCCKETCVSSSIEHEDSAGHICLHSASNHEAFMTSMHKNREDYILSYLNALKFICQPLAELVNSQKKELVAETGAAFAHQYLCSIQDALYQFSDVFISFNSYKSEREKGEFDDSKTILSVAVAAFILSIRANRKIKKSAHLAEHIIASEWVKHQGLKYLYVSLYNIGVLLYRNKQLKEASKALKLCCRASWTCVVLLCKMFVCKSEQFHGDLSERAIIDLVNEACTRSAFLLDVLHQYGSHKLGKVIMESLQQWSVAGTLFRMLPPPMALVKQWVKIEYKLHANGDAEDGVPTLCSLLLSNGNLSEKAIGIILEQELHAYEEMNPFGPEVCQRRQMEIISILLQNVYITQDSSLPKSRMLIRKGRMLRARGIASLTDCIQCLSEAISIMNDKCGKTSRHGTLLCHLLAVAYCLRALCIQEAEPNSKKVIEDVGLALNQWMNMSFCSENDECNIVSENTMLLLYNVLDLLSIKGCLEFHHDVYKLMIRLLKVKNIPLEKFLPILWEGRRLSHALCISPVNEAFLTNLAELFGEKSKSIDFWICCLKRSQPLVVGFQQSFLLLFADSFPHGCNNHGNTFQPYITAEDVKEAASELMSSVPLPAHSVFFVGYLYYDLCERLMAKGHLFEALSYAKEAHRLRSQLFQLKFSYSVDKQVEKNNEGGDGIQKLGYGPENFQITRATAAEIWSFDATSWNVDGCYLSPWNVLQCYLESTLQVGIIHELVGNGVEAETFLQWGKNISCSQSLSLFTIAFSSVLGKLYRKKQLWDLAEKELQNAKQVLVERSKSFSCFKCRLMLEVTVDQQLADLSRNLYDGASGNSTIERLFHAEKLYKSAFDKLNISEWKNSTSFPEEANSKNIYLEKTCIENVDYGASNTFVHSDLPQADTMEIPARNESTAKTGGKKCRKTKNAPKSMLKDQSLMPEYNSRMTRSKCSKLTKGNKSDLSNSISQREPVLETKNCFPYTAYEACCICSKMKCWQCLPVEVSESKLLENFVHMKWEFGRRRMALRVLTGIGKCLENRDQIHEAHDTILQSISVLFSRNPFCHTYSSVSPMFLLDLIGKEFSGDVFSVEHAAVLYNICWLSLKGCHSKKIRNHCCEFSQIQFQKIVSWLMIAFVLCREVPLLFQKVCRLLAVVFVLSSSGKHFSLPSSCKALSESHWAYFFHQASLATHLNYQFLSNMNWRYKAQHLDAEAADVTGPSCIGEDPCNLRSCRIAPESIQDLEQFVKEFFVGLPCTTIICGSLLDDTYASLLQELLLHPLCLRAWMLLSRLSSRSQPLVILLPVNTILEEASDEDDYTNLGFAKLYESKDSGKRWHCPWGSTVVDDVTPAFKLILEKNYLSSSDFPREDTKRNRSLWWMQRKNLDHRLGELLRKLEESWFGPWKYMLLGEWSNCKNLDVIQKKLARDLKSKCKVDVNESLLRVVLGGLKGDFKREENIAQLFSKQGCYIGTVGYFDKDDCRTSSKASSGGENLSELALQLIHEAVNELDLEGGESANREPIILVLDCEVQMLPWENIPILRNQEVYRMPSVVSISATLERIHHQTFPLIDPLDAFYLLNPSGDLGGTQVEFENWFRDQNLEGKAGSAPTAEELTLALKNHDLYMYFGHGSGAQYISRRDLLKLDKCAATLLMGCSSGSLSLNGCYVPHGTPLYYLLAGSPCIVANLWEVTDKDIDRFAKAMLDAWLRERSSISENCIQCISIVEDHEAKIVKGKGRKKIPRKKVAETLDNDSCTNGCHHRPKLGSFMGKAREVCVLPFLIGAAPVCYGVPTGIRRKSTL